MIDIFISIMITVAWITYGPIIRLKRIFIKEEATYDNKIIQFIQELIYCAMCSGFWIGVIIFNLKTNIYLEYVSLIILCSILSELITRKLNK